MRVSSRRLFRLLAGIVACTGGSAVDTLAQNYPLRPIRMVVGFTAGGGTDVTARKVAQKLSEQLGQPVIVENRSGAGGTIATERVATSAPDGYTMLLVTAADAIQPALRTKLPYDLERDLAPVSLVAIAPFVLVIHPSVPAHNIKELTTLARSRPGKLSYGSFGVGTSAHLMGELFNLITKTSVIHVPYKGAADTLIGTAAGHIDMSFIAVTTAMPFLKIGKLRPLGVTTAKRALLLPSLPTLDESGLRGYDRCGWYGVLVPAGVSKDLIARLNTVIGKIVNTDEIKESFNSDGLEPQANTQEQFAAYIHHEIAQNAKLIKLIGLKAE